MRRVEAAVVTDMAHGIALGAYTRVVARADEIAKRTGATLRVLDVLRRGGYALPFLMLRAGPVSGPQVCLSAGLHGDEPAGVEALLAFFERDGAGPQIGVTAFPCINPTGFVAGTRRNDIGIDLNRTFGQDPAPQETDLVRRALAGARFDCCIDLHEDPEAKGFYVYEHVRGDHRALGPRIVDAVRTIGLPINDAPMVEGRALINGCVEPAEESLSPLVGFFSVYLFDRHSDHTLVPESTPLLPMAARVAMHLATIDTVRAAL